MTLFSNLCDQTTVEVPGSRVPGGRTAVRKKKWAWVWMRSVSKSGAQLAWLGRGKRLTRKDKHFGDGGETLLAGCQNKRFGQERECFRTEKQTFAGEVAEQSGNQSFTSGVLSRREGEEEEEEEEEQRH